MVTKPIYIVIPINVTAFPIILALLIFYTREDLAQHLNGIYRPDYDRYEEVVSATSSDALEHLYSRIRPAKSYDTTILFVIVFFKFLLIKAKIFIIALIFFLKIPLILILIFGKFLVALNVAKFVNLLTLLFGIMGIFPLFAGPILLLGPLLLPLVSLLPSPLLPTTTTTTPAPRRGRRRKLHQQGNGLKKVLPSGNS